MKVLLGNAQFKRVTDKLSQDLPDHEFALCEATNVINSLEGVDILLPSTAVVNKDVISKGKFRFIQQLGTGLDKVDIEAATAEGVLVANCPGKPSGIAESVAEHAVMLMLAATRRLTQAMENVKKKTFYTPFSHTMIGKTVVVVGLGDIGKALIERIKPFKVRILGVRQNPSKGAPEGVEKVFGINQLDMAFKDADFVVIAVPENSDTRHMLNKDTIKSIKKGAYIINVARGGIIDTEALTESLSSGHLKGAGLDVFEQEPVDPNLPLFNENVIATPHTAGNTDTSFSGVLSIIEENIARFARGEEPLYAVNSPAKIRG